MKRTRINKYIKDGLNSIGVVNDDEIIELLEQVDKLVIDYRARENLLRDKDIFKAILFEGKTQKEVAEKYNISHSRIHQICFRLYLRLKTVKCEQLKEQRSKRMNKERAREELRDRKILAEIEYNQSEDAKKKDNLLRYIQALDIAIESLEREDKLIELAEQNKWHTEQPQEDRQYLVTYYQECDLLIMCKWKNKQWYDTKGIALDNDRVVAWKKVEPYERKE